MTHWVTTLSTRRDADWDTTHPEIFHFIPVGDAHVTADSVPELLADQLKEATTPMTDVPEQNASARDDDAAASQQPLITMTDSEFQIVYEALQMANTPYSHEDVPLLVMKEDQAWEVLQRVQGRSDRQH